MKCRKVGKREEATGLPYETLSAAALSNKRKKMCNVAKTKDRKVSTSIPESQLLAKGRDRKSKEHETKETRKISATKDDYRQPSSKKFRNSSCLSETPSRRKAHR